jgi:glycolate oxidase FAD binding subunit
LARINGIVAYEPEDMTVVTEAGATLGAVNQMAAERGQRLPADPPRPDLTTIGSLIAGAKAGPLRLSEGTVRDLLIGISFVGHAGRLVHAGGRVVKNVAGYDLMKVMTGSFGTLGIITEAAFKVRPVPPSYHLAVASFPTIAAAFDAAARSDRAAPLYHCEVLSGPAAATFHHGGGFVVLVGFGGIRAEVEHQRRCILEELGSGAMLLEETEAAAGYRKVRDINTDDAALVAQIAVMPAELARCLEACGREFRAHAMNGVAQLFQSKIQDTDDVRSTVARWREVARSARGHVRVIAAYPDLRAGLTIFDMPPSSSMALMRRLKSSFDPHNIFNPNSFVGGL